MQANAAMLAVVLLGNWMLPFAASQNGKDADLAQMSLLLKVTCRRSDRLLRIFFFHFVCGNVASQQKKAELSKKYYQLTLERVGFMLEE